MAQGELAKCGNRGFRTPDWEWDELPRFSQQTMTRTTRAQSETVVSEGGASGGLVRNSEKKMGSIGLPGCVVCECTGPMGVLERGNLGKTDPETAVT